MDSLEIRRIDSSQLNIYTAIPIAHEVQTILRVEPISCGLGGLRLIEHNLPNPYTKDYDRIDGRDTGPNTWLAQYNLDRWGIFLAFVNGTSAGGAAVATCTPEVNMLENRQDLAVLWDIRVQPARRHLGIGAALFRHAVDWAGKTGCTKMKIETQNINLPACRFYAKMGCELGMIHRYGYAGVPEVSEEAMLFWYYDLREN